MWCAWWDDWLLGSVVVQVLRDACPFYSPSLLGTPEHGLVMEDVSVAHDLPFKLSLGGEGERFRIGRNCLHCSGKPQNCLKI